jgi:dienelactone hydrolase
MSARLSAPILFAVLVLAPFLRAADHGGAYDPLALPSSPPEQVDLVVLDASRQREIPLRAYSPRGESRAPIILFSHGLGGSREGSAYLGRHWAARGYVAVFLQHPGSDASVWQDVPAGWRRGAMEGAASGRNFLLRVKDVPAVLDELARWNAERGHALAGRLDLGRVGMSGHSFGAVTTQAVSGQAFPGGRSFTDPRIRASVVMSPSAPRRGGDPAAAFGRVAIPWLLMTGTNDVAPIGGISLERQPEGAGLARRRRAGRLLLGPRGDRDLGGGRPPPHPAHRPPADRGNVTGVTLAVSALHILRLNTRLLPEPLRPPLWRRAGLVLMALFYGFFVCLWLASVLGPRLAAAIGSGP